MQITVVPEESFLQPCSCGACDHVELVIVTLKINGESMGFIQEPDGQISGPRADQLVLDLVAKIANEIRADHVPTYYVN